MRLVIIGATGSWHVDRLADAATRRGHAVSVVGWHLLGAEVGGTVGAEKFLPAIVDGADAIVVRGMPTGRLEEVILRMDLLGRISDRGTPVINAPRALEAAIDKYLSLARLASAGIPVPRTLVAQDADGIRAAWNALGRDAVLKPLFGSGGRGIERISAEADLDRLLAATAADGTATYLQEFVRHPGWDLRVLTVGGRPFAMRRRSSSDWRTNLARGAIGEPCTPPPPAVELARRAADRLGVEVAGVDLLPSADRFLVVEVNAVPGWRGLEAATGDDVTGAVVAWIESRSRGIAAAAGETDQPG